MKDELMHIGVIRRSGRYPWGSGDNPQQRYTSFLGLVDQLKKSGETDVQIARGMNISTTELRAMKAIAKNAQKKADIAMANRLKEKQLSNVAIGERMGLNESSVRALLADKRTDEDDILLTTANMLKTEVDKHRYLDIGAGTENHLGISQTRLMTAVAVLQDEGYQKFSIKVPQLGTGKNTEFKVLVAPDVTYKEFAQNQDKIHTIAQKSEDFGRSYIGMRPPENLSSKRVGVRYAEDGGTAKDGTIELRRGVDDISMGKSQYAQVRIAVDGTHYIKGMAVYSDNLPDGVDVMFNTNKSDTGNKLDALKPFGKDPENPFGAVIKPGGQKGVLNIVNEEGDWDKWSRNLSSQMLSKQTPELAKQQLDLKYKQKQEEFEEIMSLTNPSVKRKLLESFADDADSSAVHLKAAALPRQSSSVILPITSIKPTEIYAPNYQNGDRVVLIRYPHGGRFEIPEVTVNNRNKEARAILGMAKDAVGINSKVAERLSGADFDGDTVLVIPNRDKRVRTEPPLKALENFDPRTEYKGYEGMPKMSPDNKQKQMGDVSNLITDMTIKGAPFAEIARAVKHSMVVIDAEKHDLNYKQSAKDNGIAELKTKYQNGPKKGAATLISRASSPTRINKIKPRTASKGGPIDPATGRKMFEETNESYVDKDGVTQYKKTKIKRLEATDDAFTLVSDKYTTMEAVYATHSNKMKAIANAARKAAYETKTNPYSPSANKLYDAEVKSLNAKLNIALKNAPLERRAQLYANAKVKAKRQANPDMEKSELKKLKGIALKEARDAVGAKKTQVLFTPREWEAIQASAITNNKLTDLLKNADIDQVKALATPRAATVMTPAKLALARARLAAGHTPAEVAASLGVPPSTLNSALG